jgi:hypothetical protein
MDPRSDKMDVDQPTPTPSPKTTSYAEKLNLFEHVIGKELGSIFQSSTRLKSEGPALIGRPRAFTLPENHGISEFAQSPKAVNRFEEKGDSISPAGSFTSTLCTGSIKDSRQDHTRSANASSRFTSKSVPIGSSQGVSASQLRNTPLSPSLRRPKSFFNPIDTNEPSYTEMLVEVEYGTIDTERICPPMRTGFIALPWPKKGPTEKVSIILNEYNEDELLVKIRSDMAKLAEDPPLMQSDELFAAHAYGDESEFDKDTWKFLKKILKPEGPFMKHIKAKGDIKGSFNTSKEGFTTDSNSSSQSPKDWREEAPSSAHQDPNTKSAKPISPKSESAKTKAIHNVSTGGDAQVYISFAYLISQHY